MKCDEYYEFLFNRVPVWDKEILQDWFGPHTYPIRIDARLLPNSHRRVWLLRQFTFLPMKTIARRLKIKRSACERLWTESGRMIDNRLDAWLKRLPKRKRQKEKKLRTTMVQDAWIGKVDLGSWESYVNKTPRPG